MHGLFSSFTLLFFVASILGGCDRHEAPALVAAFGEPVGVRVADPNHPTSGALLEGAFAVSGGQPADRLIPAMARVLDAAAKACPTLVPLTARGQAVRLTANVEQGLLHVDPEDVANPEERCVREAVANQRVQADAEPPMKLVLEIATPRTGARP